MKTMVLQSDNQIGWIVKKTLLSFSILSIAVDALAANYYIRAGATGANNGSNWINAWTDVANISWASITPGTTICIAGGSYGTLNVQSSGNAINRIYIKRATASDPVCGSASSGWSSSYDSQVIMNYVRDFSGASYWTLDGVIPYTGIQVKDPSPIDATADSYAINFGTGTTPANYVELKNLDVSGPLDQDYQLPASAGERRCLNFNYLAGTANTLYVGYSKFHNAETLFSTIGVSGMTIEHSKFYNNYHTYVSASIGNHPNVWQSNGASNVIFRFNEVYNWQAEGIMMTFISPSDRPNTNWYIYGNIWHDAMRGSSSCGTYVCSRILEDQNGVVNGPIYLYNNTFVNTTWGVAPGGTWDAASRDRNNIYWGITSGGAHGLPDRANYIDGSGASGNPFQDYAGGNYRLRLDSAAIDAGVILAAINGITFDTDFFGISRPQRSAWDIGAYEYSTGVNLSPPLNLRIER